ncbi:hypothetical protein QBC36DRAFT_63189 [Triangularia setosa]|uniref:Uncharacterized protein n=1 Tax=Triangularia setosa TaxID=2587417 RepID=A0AAN6WDL4_9PEZI|nr:hypothetical protein QBC36DRAFT_63189 [Podospora setosa]
MLNSTICALQCQPSLALHLLKPSCSLPRVRTSSIALTMHISNLVVHSSHPASRRFVSSSTAVFCQHHPNEAPSSPQKGAAGKMPQDCRRTGGPAPPQRFWNHTQMKSLMGDPLRLVLRHLVPLQPMTAHREPPTIVHQTTANHHAARAECQSRPLWDMLPSSEGLIVRAPVVSLTTVPYPQIPSSPSRLFVYSPGITTFWVSC